MSSDACNRLPERWRVRKERDPNSDRPCRLGAAYGGDNHLISMALDPEKLQKPLRKLRKSLKQLPGRPSPEVIHDLRTRSRRLEAIVHALMFDRHAPGKRLLGSIAPIRKRAGKVRDIRATMRDAGAGIIE